MAQTVASIQLHFTDAGIDTENQDSTQDPKKLMYQQVVFRLLS
jgi:hypothetical protein